MNKNLNALEDHFHGAWRTMQTLKDAGQSYRAEMNAVNCAIHYYSQAKDDHEALTLKAQAAYGNPHSGCARTFAPGFFREGFTVYAPEHPERDDRLQDVLFDHYDTLTDARKSATGENHEAISRACKVARHYLKEPQKRRQLEMEGAARFMMHVRYTY